MILVLFAAAVVSVSFASPTSRVISIGPAIVTSNSHVSVDPVIVKPSNTVGPAAETEGDSTISLDPKIATPPVSVGPANIEDYKPIHVGPAIGDETSPISVGPAFYNENMQVGPANIEGAISGSGAVGHTLYQFIIKIGEMIVRGTNTVIDDESNQISVGPDTVDESHPIPVNGLTIDDGDSAAFERSGPMSARNAKIVGAISGTRAVGHTLCQFIINIDKVIADESFDLSKFPLSRINCKNIVRKWGPR